MIPVYDVVFYQQVQDSLEQVVEVAPSVLFLIDQRDLDGAWNPSRLIREQLPRGGGLPVFVLLRGEAA